MHRHASFADRQAVVSTGWIPEERKLISYLDHTCGVLKTTYVT